MVPPSSHGDSSCPVVLWIHASCFRFRLRGSHPLWRAFPDPSTTFRSIVRVLTPTVLLLPVWPLPRSLATTCGISVDFFSSAYLDVSVQRVPSVHLWIQCTVTDHCICRVSPFGHPRIEAYLRLPVAFRSLSRPSSADGAKAFPLRSFTLDLLGP